jgi:hypothetical protein
VQEAIEKYTKEFKTNNKSINTSLNAAKDDITNANRGVINEDGTITNRGVTNEDVTKFSDMRDNTTLNMFRNTLTELEKGAKEGFQVDRNIADRELSRFDATTQAANLANAQRMASNPNISQGARNAFRMEAMMTQASQRSELAGNLAMKAQERSYEALTKLSEMSLAGAELEEGMLQSDIANVFKEISNDLNAAVARGEITVAQAQIEAASNTEILRTQIEGITLELEKRKTLATNQIERDKADAAIKQANIAVLTSYDTTAKETVFNSMQVEVINPDGSTSIKVLTPEEMMNENSPYYNPAIISAVGRYYKELFGREMNINDLDSVDREWFKTYVGQVKTVTQTSMANAREKLQLTELSASAIDALLGVATSEAVLGGIAREENGKLTLTSPDGTPLFSFVPDPNNPGDWIEVTPTVNDVITTLDSTDRTGLKNFIKDNGLDVEVLTTDTDDEIREKIRIAQSDEIEPVKMIDSVDYDPLGADLEETIDIFKNPLDDKTKNVTPEYTKTIDAVMSSLELDPSQAGSFFKNEKIPDGVKRHIANKIITLNKTDPDTAVDVINADTSGTIYNLVSKSFAKSEIDVVKLEADRKNPKGTGEGDRAYYHFSELDSGKGTFFKDEHGNVCVLTADRINMKQIGTDMSAYTYKVLGDPDGKTYIKTTSATKLLVPSFISSFAALTGGGTEIVNAVNRNDYSTDLPTSKINTIWDGK